VPGIKRDIDTEFVHQARVSTRRIRSALRYFHGVVPERSAAYFEGEFKWLGGLFGAVRDLDVFLLNLLRFNGRSHAFPRRRDRPSRTDERHRREPLKALWDALESPGIEPLRAASFSSWRNLSLRGHARHWQEDGS